MDASQEIVRAFSLAGPKVVGRKKWRKILFAAHGELMAADQTPPRRDAVHILRSAMRLCLVWQR